MSGDVRAMQQLVQEVWRAAGPKVEWHVGDVAWMRWQHPGQERELKLALDDGAWGWLRRGSELAWLVQPDLKGGPRQAALLDWLEAEASGPGPLRTSAFEHDAATNAMLDRAGFAPEEGGKVLTFNVRDLAGEPDSAIPDGFTLRSVEPEDLARRVEVHRLVWDPSRVTEESYANVQRAWPYRLDLDCVVEAPDGRFAAYTLAWYDDANRVGELEPVGTHPEFRRRGLASAVCRFAFGRLRAAGAERVIVYSGDEPAQRLYESLGFCPHARLIPFVKAR